MTFVFLILDFNTYLFIFMEDLPENQVYVTGASSLKIVLLLLLFLCSLAKLNSYFASVSC